MRIIIRPEVYTQIDYYVQNSDIEVSGLGRIKKHDDGTLEVVKVYLVEQENSAATTDLDGNAVASLMYQTREDEGMLNFWWHSHVNMDVFWSGTDMDTIHQIGANGFVLATVFNKKREMRSAYYQGPMHEHFPPVFVDEIPTTIMQLPTAEQEKAWAKELKEKAKPKVIYNTWREYDRKLGKWVEKSDAVKPKKKRNRPRKNKKAKSTSLIGEQTSDEFAALQAFYKNALDKEMSEKDLMTWELLYLEAHDYSPHHIIEYEDLYTFVETWDGDLLKACNYYDDINVLEYRGKHV